MGWLIGDLNWHEVILRPERGETEIEYDDDDENMDMEEDNDRGATLNKLHNTFH